ncbi:MAG: GNAT family N-acetyltransferase [Acidimicrobiales bacterium]
MVSLRVLADDEVPATVSRITDGYVASRIDAGEDPEEVRATSAAQRKALVPEGRPAEGQHLMHEVDGADVVGLLWMGRPMAGPDSTWFDYFVEVDEGRRGRGYGRAAMEAAKRWTRERGGTRVALNVVGPNVVARSLYDALGYRVLATAMYKDVGD